MDPRGGGDAGSGQGVVAAGGVGGAARSAAVQLGRDLRIHDSKIIF